MMDLDKFGEFMNDFLKKRRSVYACETSGGNFGS